MTIKINSADSWFSKCVRERASWRCEACGQQYSIDSQGLHCSHLFSRRHRATRWDPNNAVAHCYGCHSRLGGNPIEFARWIITYLGKEKAEKLERKKNTIAKSRKSDIPKIAKHYRKEFNRMRDMRTDGFIGRIDFEGYNLDE